MGLNFLILMIVAYSFGSIPSGIWLGKSIKGLDIREHGSKNTGATNAYRVLGPKLGIIVLVLDIIKGAIPVLIARNIIVDDNLLLIIGIFCIVGHNLSIFLNFKGGKGVATSLGVFLVLAPEAILLSLLSFAVVVGVSRYVSLGSIIAALTFPISVIILNGFDKLSLFVISILLSAYIIYKHKSNIVRLLNGEENKFKK